MIIGMQQTMITGPNVLTPTELAAEVQRLIATPAQWVARVRLDLEGRWYEQIRLADDYEVWLISWMPGQSTGFHDHGGANGAFGVVWGDLDECAVSRDGTTALVNRVGSGSVRSFGPRYVHDVRNTSGSSVAVSVHAYSPPLTAMTRYDLTASGLVEVSSEGQEDW
jgi:predicted metal-dependent enzyme (double-stranded beta helix superfamily)